MRQREIKDRKCIKCPNLISRKSKNGICIYCSRSIRFKGENNPQWMGDKVSYRAIHMWMQNNFGKSNMCEGKNCKKITEYYEWANISGKYKRDRSDWIRLCKSCHMVMDRNKTCRKGHKRTKDNTIFRKNGWRICKICDNLATLNRKNK